MDIKDMRDIILEELLVTIAEDDGSFIENILKEGFKGLDNMTEEEITEQYKEMFEEEEEF